ncbi:MAG TPA: hypothetical protein PLR18_02025, partial [bacterium]|nr:hypothetical protein [bacterium]
LFSARAQAEKSPPCLCLIARHQAVNISNALDLSRPPTHRMVTSCLENNQPNGQLPCSKDCR